MDLGMAHGARLVLRGLGVARPHGLTSRAIHVWRMTAQTKKVDVVYLQHSGIGRAVWRVTGETTFIRFHRRMLEDKRAHGIGVALGADGELAGGHADLSASLGSMRIVAVAALDEANIDAMPIRPRELRLLRRMAAVAQRGLRLHQHEVNVS